MRRSLSSKHSAPRLRHASVVVALVAAIAMLAAPVSAVGPDGEGQSGSDVSLDPLAEAADRARETGSSVEVVEERSETETLFVNPSGTLTREIASAPIRVRKSGTWADIDLTLERVNGVLRPRVSAEPVELSTGGTGPLMSYSIGGVDVDVSWPGPLPEPVIDGSAAIYEDVFDGVDLRVTVTDGGVSQVLVVQDAQAAANPELRELALTTEVEDGSLKTSDDGGFEIVDKVGRTVGVSAAPLMWDSNGAVRDEDGGQLPDTTDEAIAERVEGPALGDEISPVELTVTDDALVLEPDTNALVGQDVTYPLYIDPKASSSASAWAMVFKQHASSSFYKWTDSNGQGVGYQNYDGTSTKRLFFQYSISSVTGKQIISATFKARLNWSASCTTRPIRVYRVGATISSSTTWNKQPEWMAFQDSKSYSAGWSGCNPSGRDVVWNVKTAVTNAAADGESKVAFGMRAESETD